jgi:prolyl-tRNA synthetase
MDHMGPMSFENPIGYFIVIGVIVFVIIVLLATRDKKSNVASEGADYKENTDDAQTSSEIKNEVAVNSPTKKTDIFYFRKKDGVGIATKIYPGYFKNGSALVVTPEGNYLRKKMKHCFI